MITYDNIPIHGSISVEERKTPKCCNRTCGNFEQTDSLTPVAGRCKKVTRGNVNAVVFEGDDCLYERLELEVLVQKENQETKCQ